MIIITIVIILIIRSKCKGVLKLETNVKFSKYYVNHGTLELLETLLECVLDRAGLPLLFPEVEQRRAAEGLKQQHFLVLFALGG